MSHENLLFGKIRTNIDRNLLQITSSKSEALKSFTQDQGATFHISPGKYFLQHRCHQIRKITSYRCHVNVATQPRPFTVDIVKSVAQKRLFLGKNGQNLKYEIHDLHLFTLHISAMASDLRDTLVCGCVYTYINTNLRDGIVIYLPSVFLTCSLSYVNRHVLFRSNRAVARDGKI